MARWVEINGFPNYLVSDEGRVARKRIGRIRILRPYRSKDGYLIVDLFNDFGRSVKKTHRLVAEAFCNGYFEGAEVNHKDGIKTQTPLQYQGI